MCRAGREVLHRNVVDSAVSGIYLTREMTIGPYEREHTEPARRRRGSDQTAVDHFYERVLADLSLSHFFEGVSMDGPRHTSLPFCLRPLAVQNSTAASL